jgi:class 3 adenylate cyclase
VPREIPLNDTRAMPPSTLLRRVMLFRSAAYAWLALVLVLLAAGTDAPGWLLLGCGYCVIAPFVFSAWQQWQPAVHVQHAESALTAAVAGWLALPPAPLLATGAALQTAVLAQYGWRALPVTLGAIGASAGLGWLLTPLPLVAANPAVEFASLAFVIGFTVPIAGLGYEQAMRLQGLRLTLADRAEQYQRLSERLARYQSRAVIEHLSTPHSDSERSLRRSFLSICFIDVVGFTPLAQRLAPEELSRVLDDFIAAVSTLAQRHGGWADKFVGDGALVCFGAADDNDPRRDAGACLQFAGALRTTITELNARWHAAGLTATVQIRAGIASGYCSVGDFGSGDRLDHTVIGAAVNLSSRLQAQAPPGVVWVAAATRALLAPAPDLVTVGAVHCAGFAEPEQVFELTSERNPAADGS